MTHYVGSLTSKTGKKSWDPSIFISKKKGIHSHGVSVLVRVSITENLDMLPVFSLVLVLLSWSRVALGFEFPSLSFGRQQQREAKAALLRKTAELEKKACASALSGENNKELLRSIEALEEAMPADSRLLDDDDLAMKLDGRWRLIGTLAADVGAELDEKSRRGVVNVSGIVLDADADRNVPIQTISVFERRIANEVKLPFDFYLKISGRFDRGDNARRARVDFDTIELYVKDFLIFENNWIFRLVRAFKPDLVNGDQESPWLETTYLSDTVRVGRGNKGSCFLLTRFDDDDATAVTRR